jgi:uncharacterized protein
VNHTPSPSDFSGSADEGLPTVGGIDCDVHPAIPNTDALMPYLDDYWRQSFEMRGFNRLSLAMTGHPVNAPVNRRPDWASRAGAPGSDLHRMRTDLLDGFGLATAICNPLHGSQIMHSDDMAAVLCRAVNDWLSREWLDEEPRLRGSIVISAQNADLAVEEIERRAGDRRFVQVLMLAMNDEPLGRRRYWPIYECAQAHGLPVAIHTGGSFRHAPTATGWPSHFIEDHVAQAAIAESQLLSLVAEGVFAQFDKIRFVFTETGFTWVPSFFWRADKTWRGTRAETPWIKLQPSDLVKQHVRFTLQPVDIGASPRDLERILEHLDCDEMLLFSTDYPHWQFDGRAALPGAFGETLARKILIDNPLATYGRLAEAA